MTKLTSNQESFIKMMLKGEEYERQGFELLLKRADFENFFDPLAHAALFDPSRNSGPVTANEAGSYWIPYWQPLGYLEAVAKIAGERADAELADKVMTVVRQVSQWRDDEGQTRDNYKTWVTFAKILGLLPTQSVLATDIEMLPVWLAGRFDRSMAGHALLGNTLRRFIDSQHPDDWGKACRILFHCTALEHIDEKWIGGDTRKKAQTVVKDYWLKESVSASATALGAKVGKDIADVFLARLRETFALELEGRSTWLSRPAIEDHPQNHSWEGPENRFVEGLRDALLAWVDTDPKTAQPYIDQLFAIGSEIVDRVAIHIVTQRFTALRASLALAIRPAMFDSGHAHELHQLFKTHFQAFTDDEKSATLAIIRNLPVPDRGDDSNRILRRLQRNWLSTIGGQGYQPAEDWLKELAADPSIGALSPHPDFNTYHTSSFGFGSTPHSVQELVGFAESGDIVKKLNDFVPNESFWDGPSIRSLADSVVEAVVVAPETFLQLLPSFLNAKPEYQYAVIAGFKKLWGAWDGKQAGLDWDDIWPKLVAFFEKILNDEQFWAAALVVDARTLSPNRDWVPPVISEFLRAGTREDAKAYSPTLLPRTWLLIDILLKKSEPQEKASEGDALNYAINTSKGKAVEALMDHALRACRVSDQTTKSHADVWRELQPAFDTELDACRDGNFEFSALAGAYIANLQYMDAAWTHTNFGKIFPTEFPANCLSALDGLSFAPATEPIYRELVESGVLEWALQQELKGNNTRENLIQRMSLAYLWGKETLESTSFAYLFDANLTGDLRVACRYFWSIRGEMLSGDHKERIFSFWDRCVSWSKEIEPAPTDLLSGLSLLSCHLDSIGQRELNWLLAVAPHVSVDYNADMFVEELERLATVSPIDVVQVFTCLLEKYQPAFDFEDRLKNLVKTLAENPDARPLAIKGLERLRHLPGMVQLYTSLTAKSGESG